LIVRMGFLTRVIAFTHFSSPEMNLNGKSEK